VGDVLAAVAADYPEAPGRPPRSTVDYEVLSP
jgi:hypothetical protein